MSTGMCHHQLNLQQTATCICNGSTPGRAEERRVPRSTCICACEINNGHGCVYVCVCHFRFQVNSYLCVYVYICMYMYVNTVELLQLHKVIILLLMMKYFVLKIISYSHTTTPCNLINKQPANNPTQQKSPTGHTHQLRLNLQRLMRRINVISLQF